MSRTVLGCLFSIGLLAQLGCQTCCRQDISANRPPCNNCGDRPAPSRFSPVPRPFNQPQPAPPRPARIPPIASIDGPTPATYFTPAPGDKTPAPPLADNTERDEPAPFPSSPLEDQRVQLLPPRRSQSLEPTPRPRDTDEPPIANLPGPRPKDKRDDIEGLLNFREVNSEIATGICPDERETQWLKQKRYRVVFHVRIPGNAPTEQKRIVNKYGLKYVTMTASPRSLSKETYESFVKEVNDADNQPLYVCDDGTRVVGGLWYLYFRINKKYSDENARAEAKRLGLDFSSDEDLAVSMILAVQKYLEKYPLSE